MLLECDTLVRMIRLSVRPNVAGTAVLAVMLGLSAARLVLSSSPSLLAQAQQAVWTGQEKPIADQIRGLRALPDDVRARTTKQLAMEIRQLPLTPNKLRLANDLANLSTEGDFGRDTLQEVATTLEAALREQPVRADRDRGWFDGFDLIVRPRHFRLRRAQSWRGAELPTH